MTNLDDLRVKLDQTTERLVSRLKDRSRLPLNEAVYVPNAVPIDGRSGISFLQFSIEGLEDYHASLGRYEYRDQHPILSRALPKSPTARLGTATDLSDTDMSGPQTKLTDDILAFYRTILPEMCRKGDDPKSYGETVYVDADFLALTHERIDTAGRYVAHSKFMANPDIIRLEDDTSIIAALRNEKREDAVVKAAKDASVRYEFSPEITERVFRWVIKEPVTIEVAYLKSLARSEAPKTRVKAQA